MDSAEEKQLIGRAKGGDEDAFEKLIDSYEHLVRDRIFNLLPDYLEMHTDDVYQETFFKAWNALPKFRIERPGGFRKWLTTIAANAALDVIRSAPKRHVEFDDNDDGLLIRGLGTLVDEPDIGALHERVRLALSVLHYDCRILIIAAFAYGIAPADLARMASNTLSPGGKRTSMGARMQGWFRDLIGPLETQMTSRKNHCFKELKENIEKISSPVTKAGTLRESRGGSAKTN